MCKVSVGSVSKILLVLTQGLYEFNTNAAHLQAEITFLLQQSRTIIVILQSCHSITHVDCSGM